MDRILAQPYFSHHIDYRSLSTLVRVSTILRDFITSIRKDVTFWQSLAIREWIVLPLGNDSSPITYDWYHGYRKDASVNRLGLIQSKENCKTILGEIARYRRNGRKRIAVGIVRAVLPLILEGKAPVTSLDTLLSIEPCVWNTNSERTTPIEMLVRGKNADVYLHFRHRSLPAAKVLKYLANSELGSLFTFYSTIDPLLLEEHDERHISKILSSISSVSELIALSDYAVKHLYEHDRKDTVAAYLITNDQTVSSEESRKLIAGWKVQPDLEEW